MTAVEERLQQYGRMVAEHPGNLVSKGDRERVEAVHLPDSVATIGALSLQPGGQYLDLGTGGGFPGMVGALMRPDTHWTLIDGARRKAEAVAGFACRLDAHNVETVHGRAEELCREEAHRGAYDGVVCRAVGPLAVVAELARGFVGDGGWLAAVKGAGWQEDLETARRALEVLAWRYVETIRTTSAVRDTRLVILEAIGAPPERFPRRTGVPARRPLAQGGGRVSRETEKDDYEPHECDP